MITDAKGNQKVIKSNQLKTVVRLENTGVDEIYIFFDSLIPCIKKP